MGWAQWTHCGAGGQEWGWASLNSPLLSSTGAWPSVWGVRVTVATDVLKHVAFCLPSEFSSRDRCPGGGRLGQRCKRLCALLCSTRAARGSDARSPHSCSHNHSCCLGSAFPFPEHLPREACGSASLKVGVTWVFLFQQVQGNSERRTACPKAHSCQGDSEPQLGAVARALLPMPPGD